MGKTALITGITGQDGYYLTKFLLNKGYTVYGIYRRTSQDPLMHVNKLDGRVRLVEGDMTDMGSLLNVVKTVQPDEIYNLAAQSFVPSSWTQPISTAKITGIGALNILEVIKNINPKIRYYQASTSELYGKIQETPQTEKTPFYPRSPYGVAKLYAYWITVNYRESYGIHASNGILFNHESPKRGKQFVTRKITHSVAKIKLGIQDYFEIGNLNSKRDWGYAGDYVESMWLMLQQEKPGNYVIATGETRSVREFVEEAFSAVGMDIEWKGEGLDEVGIVNEKIVVRVSSKFYRPAEVDILIGNPKKAVDKLGWNPTRVKFKELVKMMIKADLKELEEHGLSKVDRGHLDIK
jgi:GDPmannose 4,6-dehydratase